MSKWPLMLLVLAGASTGLSRARAGAFSAPPPPARTSTPQRPGWLSFDDLVRLARDVGFSPDSAYTAARFAWRESGGNPLAQAIVTHPTPGHLPERSFGLWQVNTLASPQYDEALLLDPFYNAQAAYALSRGGTDWRPWRT